MNAEEICNCIVSTLEAKNAAIDHAKHKVFAVIMHSIGCVIVKSVRFIGDEIIVFEGNDTKDRPATVIQHVAQVNFAIVIWDIPEEPSVPKNVVKFRGRKKEPASTQHP